MFPYINQVKSEALSKPTKGRIIARGLWQQRYSTLLKKNVQLREVQITQTAKPGGGYRVRLTSDKDSISGVTNCLQRSLPRDSARSFNSAAAVMRNSSCRTHTNTAEFSRLAKTSFILSEYSPNCFTIHKCFTLQKCFTLHKKPNNTRTLPTAGNTIDNTVQHYR